MKAGVVGLGRMGRRHLQALRDLGADVVGAADPREENARIAVGEHPIGRLYADAGDLLREHRLDLLVVASTAPSHAPMTLAAIEAGVPRILCEKPMASSLDECDEMVRAAQRRGARLAVNHQMRFMEQYTEARRLIEAPEFGGWSSINVIAGNFGLAMNGTHYFELLRWLAGEPAAEVTAWFSPEKLSNPRGPEFFDRAGQVRLRTRNGKRMYIDAGADQGLGMRVMYAGRTGTLTTDELAGWIDVSVRVPESRDLPTTRYAEPTIAERLHVAPADNVTPTRRVLEALCNDGDFPTGEDGRAAIETLVAAYVSAESGGATVSVDPAALPRGRRFDHA